MGDVTHRPLTWSSNAPRERERSLENFAVYLRHFTVVMGKRRLRNCTNCGTRHGPPTGKSCSHLAEEFEAKNEEMVAEKLNPEAGAEGGETDSDSESTKPLKPLAAFDEEDQIEWLFPEFPGIKEDKLRAQEMASGARPKGRARCQSPSARRQSPGGGAELPPSGKAAKWGRAYQQQHPPTTSAFEENMSERMAHVENLVGKMAGVQQSQMDRLIKLSANQAEAMKKLEKAASAESAGIKKSIKKAADQSEGAHGGHAPSVPGRATSKGAWTFPELDYSYSDEEPDEWEEFYGPTIWKKELDKKRRNPFDQKNYWKKGESIDSFEKLMAITFKTIDQLLDYKIDVRGIVKHGLTVSEKAAKDVFKSEAFISYDISVRDRAGQVGPSAFGAVEQEDIIRFFCYDNTKQRTFTKKDTKPASHSKKEKTCLRFNDSGCTTKGCAFAHKCLACEEWGHPRKECKALGKKKDSK